MKNRGWVAIGESNKSNAGEHDRRGIRMGKEYCRREYGKQCKADTFEWWLAQEKVSVRKYII